MQRDERNGERRRFDGVDVPRQRRQRGLGVETRRRSSRSAFSEETVSCRSDADVKGDRIPEFR